MRLVNFQTIDALKVLIAKGYLESNPNLSYSKSCKDVYRK